MLTMAGEERREGRRLGGRGPAFEALLAFPAVAAEGGRRFHDRPAVAPMAEEDAWENSGNDEDELAENEARAQRFLSARVRFRHGLKVLFYLGDTDLSNADGARRSPPDGVRKVGSASCDQLISPVR